MPVPKINGPKKKATKKGGFFSAENAPLIVGGVLGGAALLLYMSSRNSQNVSVGPALTLNPSTDADQSTVANLTAAVQAIGAAKKNTPTGVGNPNPIPAPPGTPNTPSSPVPTNSQWMDYFNAFYNNWTHNIPVGGSGSGGTGTAPPPSQTGTSHPTAPPLGSTLPPSILSGLPGHNYDAGVGAYQYVGNPPSSFNPAPITPFQTAIDLGSANPSNPQDVSFIANNYYQGNTALAQQGIVNAQASQSGDWSNPMVQANQAAVNPVGTYLNQHPGASVVDANRALGNIP